MAMRVGFEMRGPYGVDEQRPALKDRPHGSSWTEFEKRLFDLVTTGYDRRPTSSRGFLFSRHLAAVEAALAAVDREMAP